MSADLPVAEVPAWEDSAGQLHRTKEAALLVEIERVLGRFGNTAGSESLTPGLARLLVEKRAQVAPLLEAFGPVLVAAEDEARAAA